MAETRTIERLVIFGVTGDLAGRMLLPSLYYLDADGHLPKALKIIGAARSEMDQAGFAKYVRDTLDKRTEGVDDAVWERFKARLDYCVADVTTAAGLKPVAEQVGEA